MGGNLSKSGQCSCLKSSRGSLYELERVPSLVPRVPKGLEDTLGQRLEVSGYDVICCGQNNNLSNHL